MDNSPTAEAVKEFGSTRIGLKLGKFAGWEGGSRWIQGAISSTRPRLKVQRLPPRINYSIQLTSEASVTTQAKHLEFAFRYCVNELSRESHFMFDEALAPKVENFESWNITRDGIRFNFDACRVFGCASGEQAVVIPFTALKQLFNREGLKMVI